MSPINHNDFQVCTTNQMLRLSYIDFMWEIRDHLKKKQVEQPKLMS